MNNLNTVLIEGNLTRDPQMSNSSSESSVCRMSLANNRYFSLKKDGKDEWKQETSYFTIFVFGPVADACAIHLKKGRGIRVVGRLRQYRYSDNGMPRERIYIMAEHIEFQPDRKDEKKSDKEPQIEPERIPGVVNTSAVNLGDLVPQQEPEEKHEPGEITISDPPAELEMAEPETQENSEIPEEPEQTTEEDERSF